MRPVSPLTRAFLTIFDGFPSLIWFGLFAWLSQLASQYSELPFLYVCLPIGMTAAVVMGYALRPIRRFIQLAICRDLAKSKIGVLREVGVVKLLGVAYRFWDNQPVTDFVGLAALHEVHDQMEWRCQMRLRAIAHRIEYASNSPLSVAAREFLSEVEVAQPWPGSIQTHVRSTVAA